MLIQECAMNRFTFRTILAVFCLLLPCMAVALPGPHDPTTSGNGGSCDNCHTPGATLGAGTYNNICLTCHNGTSTTSIVNGSRIIQPFTQTDYADPYNAADARINPLQSSHKWTGTDVVPQAGALSPTDPYQTTTRGMNKLSLIGSVTCARCHNVHGNSGTSSFVYPYLRSPNDNDQMCLDCHRSRNHSVQSFGTHPVNVNLNTVAKAKPFDYYTSPLNANPSNSTSALKIIGGVIQCSTCHRVHYTDSKSGSTHNAANFNKLSTSRGGLLRTDVYGKTATSLNVCTNCHIRANHNVGGQNIQCNDCHTGHVDYVSPADIALNPQEATPNKYMLRRYVNYSSDANGKNTKKLSTFRKKMIYWNTSGWRNPQNTGVCQACHKLPGTVTEHSDPTINTAAKCQLCHSGGTHATTAPVGCTGCHGSPPEHTVAGTVSKGGYAVYSSTNDITKITKSYLLSTPLVYKNESTAGHPTHASGKPYIYACDQCHKGNTHKTQTYQDVFVQAGTLSPAATFTPGPVTSTCANMYCHSYGTAVLTNAKSIGWAAGVRGSIVGSANRCVACHNGVIAGFNTMSTNSHFRHVSNVAATGKNIGCVVCHSATVSSNTTISNTANHVNGAREVAYDGTTVGISLTTSTWNGTTCSTYCHSNGKGALVAATWTNRSSGACGTCHAATSPMIATNAHFTHISTATANAWGPGLSGTDVVICSKCHTYTGELGATHVNGTLEAPVANCTSTCHRNATPVWTSAARLACETCHDGLVSYDSRPGFNNISAPRKVMTTFTTKGHGLYNAYYCTQCHDNTKKHISGKRSYTKRLGVYESNKNGLCFSCHNNVVIVPNPARQNLPTHVLDKLATPTPSLCTTCHDTHGTNNYASVLSNITFKAVSAAVPVVKPTTATGFISTTTRRGLCQVCHTITNHYRRDITEPVNGFSGSGTDHSTFDATTNCLTCHKHTGSYAFYPSGGACDGCHGYPPVPKSFVKSAGNYNNSLIENYSGAGGSHIVPGHIPKTANPAKGWTLCNSCHNVSDHNMGGDFTKAAQIKATISSRLRFNSAVLPKYTSNRLNGTSHLVGNCSNVSCHFQASPKWGNKP